jgi:membrane protein
MRLQRILRAYYRFFREFIVALFDDKLNFYAASLSFYTLFSIVPLLVILFSIVTNLPMFDTMYQNIESVLFANLLPTHSKEILTYIDGFIENSGKLGVVGVIYVLVASMMFFKNYDYIVNDIFMCAPRGFWSSVSVYWTLVTLTPIMMVLSFYFSKYVKEVLEQSQLVTGSEILTLLPFLIIWLSFFVIYKISANTNVSNTAAGVSSFIVSLVWYLAKVGFVFYVLHNKTYLSIYGSLSTLLFFFVWIYISWLIFLYGLKFCYLLERDSQKDG